MILGIVFLLSGTVRAISPFMLSYRWIVSPLGIMKSDYRLDNIQPHKFGQIVGAFTILLALGLIQYDVPLAGWFVVSVLILLAVISYAGWCIGCFLYYQMNRFGVGGFFSNAPKDKRVFPGMRPGKMKKRGDDVDTG